jgi:hypothetical protein
MGPSRSDPLIRGALEASRSLRKPKQDVNGAASTLTGSNRHCAARYPTPMPGGDVRRGAIRSAHSGDHAILLVPPAKQSRHPQCPYATYTLPARQNSAPAAAGESPRGDRMGGSHRAGAHRNAKGTRVVITSALRCWTLSPRGSSQRNSMDKAITGRRSSQY